MSKTLSLQKFLGEFSQHSVIGHIFLLYAKFNFVSVYISSLMKLGPQFFGHKKRLKNIIKYFKEQFTNFVYQKSELSEQSGLHKESLLVELLIEAKISFS